MQKKCNLILIIQIKWCWFHSEIFIFSQVISDGQKIAHMPVLCHTFFGHNSALFGPKSWRTGWNFWANRYLEIDFSKFSGVNPSGWSVDGLASASLLRIIRFSHSETPSPSPADVICYHDNHCDVIFYHDNHCAVI